VGIRTAVVVLDIDGVLADVGHRLHHLRRRPKDWEAFFAALPEDPVLEPGRELAWRLVESHPVVYLTGRPQRYADATRSWLRQHDLPEGPLLQRPDGDRRPARVVKPILLEQLAHNFDIHLVVDDDEAVCAAYREAGHRVLWATWANPQHTLFEAQEHDGVT